MAAAHGRPEDRAGQPGPSRGRVGTGADIQRGGSPIALRALRDEIAGFFDDFGEAFGSFSGARIAARYHVPGVALRGDGSIQCLRSRGEVEGFFQAAVDAYRRDGARGIRFRDLDVVAMGARSVLGTVTWELLGQDGSVLRDWRQSYNLVRVDPGWRILASTYHVG